MDPSPADWSALSDPSVGLQFIGERLDRTFKSDRRWCHRRRLPTPRKFGSVYGGLWSPLKIAQLRQQQLPFDPSALPGAQS